MCKDIFQLFFLNCWFIVDSTQHIQAISCHEFDGIGGGGGGAANSRGVTTEPQMVTMSKRQYRIAKNTGKAILPKNSVTDF